MTTRNTILAIGGIILAVLAVEGAMTWSSRAQRFASPNFNLVSRQDGAEIVVSSRYPREFSLKFEAPGQPPVEFGSAGDLYVGYRVDVAVAKVEDGKLSLTDYPHRKATQTLPASSEPLQLSWINTTQIFAKSEPVPLGNSGVTVTFVDSKAQPSTAAIQK